MNNRIEKLKMGNDEAVFITSYPNIFYYSGFRSADACLLISHDKKFLITDSRYTIQAKQQAPDFEIIDIETGFSNIFSRVSEKYIGYEEMNMTVKNYRKYERKLGNKEFIEMQSIIDAPRRIKDKDEIEAIKVAEEIGDSAFAYILDVIEAGMTEIEVAAYIEDYMRKEGASGTSFETICASGVRSAMPHGIASEKVIEKGDLLTMDFGCIYNGYCSDMTRTVAIGSIDEKQREIYNTVLKAQLAAIDAIKPGVTCSSVDTVARDIIDNAGFKGCFGHSLGHSLGIEIHEKPVFSQKCNDIVKTGNVITVEPGIYIENFGGVRIEDVVVVTENGIENLTFSPKELIIL